MHIRLLTCTALLALVGASATAQSPHSLSVGGGGSLPLSRFDRSATNGWHALVSVGLSSIMQPASLRADIAHNRFGGEGTIPSPNITSATANLAYRLPMTRSPVSPYVITGAGAYRLACTGAPACDASTHVGWNAGLGFRFAALGLRGFIEGRWHALNPEGGNVRFVPVTFGLTL